MELNHGLPNGVSTLVGDDQIVHSGIVQSWHDGVAEVLVLRDNDSSCVACGAKDSCALVASGKGKPSSVIGIPYAQELARGTKVSVSLKKNGDWKATLIAFVGPVVFMMGGVGVGAAFKLGELGSALLALALLGLYGLLLLGLRKRLNKTFAMTICRVE